MTALHFLPADAAVEIVHKEGGKANGHRKNEHPPAHLQRPNDVRTNAEAIHYPVAVIFFFHSIAQIDKKSNPYAYAGLTDRSGFCFLVVEISTKSCYDEFVEKSTGL
ncbi:MAG: hypothetical protein IKM36_00505 [Oscillospiraceae bacterium]|nr:hypothetical protein [Oscillospiraceae bacterium]